MDSLERYLRQATRGLWGPKRLEVREELEAHILERARAFEVGGLTRLEAVEKVLAELGRPEAVSAGMARLHSWPKVGLLASAMGLMAASLLLVQAQSYEVTPLDRIPISSCLEAQTVSLRCQLFQNTWLSWSDLKKALEPQGVKIERDSGFYLYEIGFPGGTLMGWPDPGLRNPSYNLETVSNEFIDLISLAQIVAYRAALPVRLEGWERPRIWFGDKVSLNISTSNQPNLGYKVYSRMLVQRCPCFDPTFFYNFLRWFQPYEKRIPPIAAINTASSEVAWHLHRIKLEGGSGKVWGVWLPSVSEGLNRTRNVNIYADVAAAKDGFVELYLPDDEVQFVGSFAEASRSLTVGTPSKAALVDLSQPYTKDGWSKAIVVPQNPVSKALR